jgi:hypothetical protein
VPGIPDSTRPRRSPRANEQCVRTVASDRIHGTILETPNREDNRVNPRPKRNVWFLIHKAFLPVCANGNLARSGVYACLPSRSSQARPFASGRRSARGPGPPSLGDGPAARRRQRSMRLIVPIKPSGTIILSSRRKQYGSNKMRRAIAFFCTKGPIIPSSRLKYLLHNDIRRPRPVFPTILSSRATHYF